MASRRIQGITIEIDGDTQKLNSALKSTDKQLASTQAQLKDVGRLLKLDPRNTELLTQKQGLLNDAIKDSKSRLQDLEKAAAQLAEKDSTPEVQKQQAALQREIIETQQKLKGFEDELGKIPNKASLAFGALGEGLQNAGEKITTIGDGLTKNVTAPIAAAGAASTAAFMDVDEAMDTVILKTGATGEAAKNLQGIVENLATSIPTDFNTAANAVGELNTKFGLTGKALEKASATFIKFASINKKDVSSSIDNVQKAMSAYGLSVDQAEHFLDILTKTSQDTGADVDKLTDGVVQNAAAFEAMGLSVDDAVNLMGQMERSGANSETVMNGLRKALKNAAKDGKPLGSVLSDLQYQIRNSNDETAALNATYEIFGKSGDQIFNAIKNGTLDFENFGKTLNTVGGTVERTFDETVDGVDNWTMAMNEAKLIAADVGGILSEFAGPILQKLRDGLRDALTWWRGLSDQQQETILKTAGIVAAIGPAVSIIGRMTSAVGMLSKGLGVLAAHPVAAAFLGIGAAAGGAVIAIKNHTDALKEAYQESIGNTKEVRALTEAIEEQAQAYAEATEAKNSTIDSLDTEYGHLQDLAEEYDDYLEKNGDLTEKEKERAAFIEEELCKSLGIERDEIDKIVQKNGELSSSIDEIIEKRKAEAVLNALESDYTEAILQSKDAEINLANALAARSKQEKLVNDLDARRKELTKQINDLTDDQGRALNGLEGSVQPLREELGDLTLQYEDAAAMLGVMDKAVETAQNTYDGYQTTIRNYEGVSAAIIDGDTTKISKSMAAFRQDFKTTETATKETLRRQYETLDQEYNNMVAAVKSGDKRITQEDLAEKRYWRQQALAEYSKATEDTRNAARDSVNAYSNRMREGRQQAANAAAYVGGGATTELQKSAQAAADSGYNFASGFASGISNAAYRVTNAAQDMAARARNKTNQLLGINSPSKVMMQTGEFFSEGFAIGITKGAGDAIAAASSMAGNTAGAVTGEARAAVVSASPYNDSGLVGAFRAAMSGMKVMLDDEVAGAFVEDTVSKAVYQI